MWYARSAETPSPPCMVAGSAATRWCRWGIHDQPHCRVATAACSDLSTGAGRVLLGAARFAEKETRLLACTSHTGQSSPRPRLRNPTPFQGINPFTACGCIRLWKTGCSVPLDHVAGPLALCLVQQRGVPTDMFKRPGGRLLGESVRLRASPGNRSRIHRPIPLTERSLDKPN